MNFTNKYRKMIDFIRPKSLKTKGKQYARPFIFKSYLSMAELNLQADMDYFSKQIYSAFKIPSNLIQRYGDMINKSLISNPEYGKSKLLQYIKNHI